MNTVDALSVFFPALNLLLLIFVVRSLVRTHRGTTNGHTSNKDTHYVVMGDSIRLLLHAEILCPVCRDKLRAVLSEALVAHADP